MHRLLARYTPTEEILLLREIRDALAGPRPEVAHPTMQAHDPDVD
jgi:hypothetical protein